MARKDFEKVLAQNSNYPGLREHRIDPEAGRKEKARLLLLGSERRRLTLHRGGHGQLLSAVGWNGVYLAEVARHAPPGMAT